jgi:serine/threonine protein kinase
MESKYSESKHDEKSGLASWQLIDFSEIELGERIGGGGVGVIYKGFWKDQPVALKTLFDPRISEDLKKEYMDELLVMSKLNHSNIVKFMGASMTPPNLCFVMEICDCSLHDLLHVSRQRLSDYEMTQMAVSS